MKNIFKMKAGAFLKMAVAPVMIAMLCVNGVSAQEIKGQTVGESVTVTATVTEINQKSRKVTIKTEDGKKKSFVAGPDVVNLAQVKKGDVITATYTEALAYEVRKHNKDTGVAVTQAAARAVPGEKPAGAVMQQTTVAVTITAIDKSVPSVTFRGPKGNYRTITVKDPVKLNGVKVGDVVDITYTEALAIKVDPPAKK